MDIYDEITQAVDAMLPHLVGQRRDFHKYAELGWHEMRTSSILAGKLADLGYEVLVGGQVCKREARMGLPSTESLKQAYDRAVAQGADARFVSDTKDGMTGVIGILRCGEGPTVALRFDIDALGVPEETAPSHLPAGQGFRSVNEGVMHACGHDGHAAIGLGVAELLMKLKNTLHGTVKLIFQPAEEGVRGAKAIVDNGHLDDVDYMLGAHITDCAAGETAAALMGTDGALATYKYDITFYGKAAHAAGTPELGKNAMLAAAAAITNLYAIPRHSGGETRINVGRVTAGSSRNVIADEASMEMEIRGATTEVNAFVNQYAMNIIEGAAKMHGCTYEKKLMGTAHSIVCDKELMDQLASVCTGQMKLPVLNRMGNNGGSEDVSYMMHRVQQHGGKATFMRLLTPLAGPPHSRAFDFGEKALGNGVKIFCASVVHLLSP